MNNSVIRFILGYVVGFLGLFLTLPIIVALIYHEDVWFEYAIVAFPCLILGVINSYFKPKKFFFYLKEGFFCTGASWVFLSVIGAIPLWLTGEIPSYVDALFEAVSGFTTTGASIIPNVEALSHASLFWRSFTHLIGGMGVLVFLLTVIPLAGGDGSQFNLMKAESPGPSVGKLVPKLKNTAQMLYLIYLGLCTLEIILLLIAGMSRQSFLAIRHVDSPPSLWLHSSWVAFSCCALVFLVSIWVAFSMRQRKGRRIWRVSIMMKRSTKYI